MIGSIPLKRLLEGPTDVALREIGRMDATRLRPVAGFEEVARLIADFDLLAAPVVDDDNRIMGIITADDVLELMMPKRWRRRYRPTDPAPPGRDGDPGA